MSAEITHSLNHSTLHHHQHHLHQNFSTYSSMAELVNNINATLPMGPPRQAQKGGVLSPHIKVQSSHQKCSSGVTFFAMPVLLNSASGAVIENPPFKGTTLEMGVLREDGSTMDWTFANLAITAAGNYQLRLDVYSKDPAGGVDVEAQLKTAEISVHD